MHTATNPTPRATTLSLAAVSFPGDPAPAARAARDETREAAQPLALVVDDAPDVTEMIAVLMRLAGYEVVTAFGAAAAFEAARRTPFDVVISDIGMPGMNGYELAAALRALPAYEGVPLIAVSGFATYSDRERALGSGFDDFLTKPINPSDLVDKVNRLRE